MSSCIVLTAIDFNDESRGIADEVDDVFADWGLAPKAASSKLLPAESPPQAFFGVGWIAAKSLCFV